MKKVILLSNLAVALLLAAPFSWGTGKLSPVPVCDSLNGVFAGFNVFVLRDFVAPSSDIQGRLAAARDVRIAHYSVGALLPVDPNRFDVVAGRDFIFEQGSVPHGSAMYGNIAWLGAGATIGGALTRGTLIDFTALEHNAIRVSGELASFPSAGDVQVNYTGDRAQVELRASQPDLNVFTLSSRDLSRAHTFLLDGGKEATAIINVIGETATLSNFAMFLSGGIDRSRVLFNFPDARSLVIQSIAVEGSILAPRAGVTFSTGLITGDVFAESINGAGQFNLAPFSGCVPRADIVKPPPVLRVRCTKDAFLDSISGKKVGKTPFEFYGMAVAEWGSYIVVALNADLGIKGHVSAKGTNIGWGDFIFNFSGQRDRFKAARTEHLFAVKFAKGTDSGVSEPGLYRDVVAKHVAELNEGKRTYGAYKKFVQSVGHRFGLGDLDPNGHYFSENEHIPTSIASGTRVQDDEFRILGHDELLGLGIDLSACLGVPWQKLGRNTIGFIVKRPHDMIGGFDAHISPECGNDLMGIRGSFGPISKEMVLD